MLLDHGAKPEAGGGRDRTLLNQVVGTGTPRNVIPSAAGVPRRDLLYTCRVFGVVLETPSFGLFRQGVQYILEMRYQTTTRALYILVRTLDPVPLSYPHQPSTSSELRLCHLRSTPEMYRHPSMLLRPDRN